MAAKSENVEEIELREFIQGAKAVDSDISIEDLLKLANDTEYFKKLFESAKNIQILIIGKTGAGKSTLINGLIGEEVAEVFAGLLTSGVSTEITPYSKRIGGICVEVFDSPGLHDGSGNEKQYLDDLYEKCCDVDLVMFAIRLGDNRFVPNNPDAQALVKFTARFGANIWKRTIVIITCCNLAEDLNPSTKSMSAGKKKEFFRKLIDDYRAVIHKTLTDDANVPPSIVERVKVIPTGHEFAEKLMDETLWFSNFWLECLTAVQTREGRATMIKINAKRFKSDKTVTKSDFSKPIDEQPIIIPVLHDHDPDYIKLPVTVGTVLGSAACGAALGTLGLVGGPVGAVGIPVGLFVGLVVGAIGAVRLHKD